MKSGRREVVITSEWTGDDEHVFITDVESGELIKHYWRKAMDRLPGRPKGGKKPHFLKLYHTNLQDIVRRKHLKPYMAGVFFMAMAFVGWESNFLVHPDTGKNLTCSSLAKLIGINPDVLRGTLEQLNEKGLISIVKNGNGYSNNYMLNSNVVFWGQKIKDKSEHDAFSACNYKPPVKLKYEERVLVKEVDRDYPSEVKPFNGKSSKRN